MSVRLSVCYITPSPEESVSSPITREHLWGGPLDHLIFVVVEPFFENIVKLVLVVEEVQVVFPPVAILLDQVQGPVELPQQDQLGQLVHGHQSLLQV